MAIHSLPKLVFLLLATTSLITAQSTSSTASSAAPASTASSTAVINPGNVKWGYYGCYNETTELASTGNSRALAGFEPTRSETMTVETCFDTCNAKGKSFAGLEYTNECFCADHLNALSVKLDDSQCDLACAGNKTQYCGGALKLTVYTVKTEEQRKADEKKGSAVKGVPESSILALGVAMGMMLWLA